MKYALLAALLGVCSTAHADQYVNGYFNKYGTYVQPHMRSDNNGYFGDNWSESGNVNPYTGQVGTRHSDYGNNSTGYRHRQPCYGC